MQIEKQLAASPLLPLPLPDDVFERLKGSLEAGHDHGGVWGGGGGGVGLALSRGLELRARQVFQAYFYRDDVC